MWHVIKNSLTTSQIPWLFQVYKIPTIPGFPGLWEPRLIATNEWWTSTWAFQNESWIWVQIKKSLKICRISDLQKIVGIRKRQNSDSDSNSVTSLLIMHSRTARHFPPDWSQHSYPCGGYSHHTYIIVSATRVSILLLISQCAGDANVSVTGGCGWLGVVDTRLA